MLSQTVCRDLLGAGPLSLARGSDQPWVLGAMRNLGPQLVTMLWRILGNEQDVCDVYQTTFLRLAHVEAGTRPANVQAYVFRTASNAAISVMRSRALERRTCTALAGPERQEAVPDHEIDQRALIESLQYYLGQLPEHLRQVVVLRDLAEMPYAQVAKTLGITQATARVYRCKALALLGLWMDDGDKD